MLLDRHEPGHGEFLRKTCCRIGGQGSSLFVDQLSKISIVQGARQGQASAKAGDVAPNCLIMPKAEAISHMDGLD